MIYFIKLLIRIINYHITKYILNKKYNTLIHVITNFAEKVTEERKND